MERKEALKIIGKVTAGLTITASATLPAIAQEKKEATKAKDFKIKLPDPSPDEDIIITMQRDLLKALNKPLEQRKWSMTIDLKKCIGCHACTISCIAENKLGPNVVYRPVKEEEIGTYPNLSFKFLPRPCMQCEEPPCTPVCPVQATWKREDGIVVIDYDKCIGCRYCIAACPYGARSSESGTNFTDNTPKVQPYETLPSYEYNKKWEKGGHFKSPVGNARKCHFCTQRIENGLLPQCVTTCVGRATYFGDVSDNSNLITKVTVSSRAWKYKEGMGTHPSVTYLV